MTQPTIIALTSTRGRSGKDTLIEELVKAGHNVYRVAFGDVLKERCADAIATDIFSRGDLLEFFHSDSKDQTMPGLSIDMIATGPYRDYLIGRGHDRAESRSPRWHLQQFGTDYSRVHLNDPDVWLREGIAEIQKAPEGYVVVVTDLRQQNEYIALSELTEGKFFPVRMQRMWFNESVDAADYHKTDLDLIGFFMKAVVLNSWGLQSTMVPQLRKQGVPV